MFRVYIHLTTGEKLRSFRAQEFDIDLGRRDEDGLQKYAYTGPEGEEATIYLNPKGVAAIETRPVKERQSQRFEDPASAGRNRPLSGPSGGKRDLLAMEDEQEKDLLPLDPDAECPQSPG